MKMSVFIVIETHVTWNNVPTSCFNSFMDNNGGLWQRINHCLGVGFIFVRRVIVGSVF